MCADWFKIVFAVDVMMTKLNKLLILFSVLEFSKGNRKHVLCVSIKFWYKNNVLAFYHECYSLIGFPTDYL